MRLLVVEDHGELRDSLASGLRAEGYQVDTAADGAEGWRLAAAAEHDLIVLDRMLPALDGLEVVRRLRRAGSAVPVLLLTARDGVDERVAGLDAGADDYLPKPFAVAELLARIRALLRRGSGRADPVVEVAGVEIDSTARAVRRAGRRIDLTAKEWALLECLLARLGTPVPRAELFARLYPGEDEATASNVVDALVARLRRKLEPAGTEPVIVTRRGLGYQLADGETA